ncbi:hypothetical protein LTR62_005054 [Meristemomyces frigidus]|uniref:Uncharacterized protein n=1 Tax=Meristemomyces frigidus TaxID=1508187 RepID=A0AAN7YTK2_9PEZI|nr:hypothetical protein LTR62_005054 [Meristemomyces frigidus]
MHTAAVQATQVDLTASSGRGTYQVISIYHSCDPRDAEILRHFKHGKHKIDVSTVDPQALAPQVLLPVAKGLTKSVMRCIIPDCARCEDTSIFSDLTLGVAKSHGLTRVPLKPEPKGDTARERLADAGLRARWMYRGLKPNELVVFPLRHPNAWLKVADPLTSKVEIWRRAVKPGFLEMGFGTGGRDGDGQLRMPGREIPCFDEDDGDLASGADWELVRRRKMVRASQAQLPVRGHLPPGHFGPQVQQQSLPWGYQVPMQHGAIANHGLGVAITPSDSILAAPHPSAGFLDHDQQLRDLASTVVNAGLAQGAYQYHNTYDYPIAAWTPFTNYSEQYWAAAHSHCQPQVAMPYDGSSWQMAQPMGAPGYMYGAHAPSSPWPAQFEYGQQSLPNLPYNYQAPRGQKRMYPEDATAPGVETKRFRYWWLPSTSGAY